MFTDRPVSFWLPSQLAGTRQPRGRDSGIAPFRAEPKWLGEAAVPVRRWFVFVRPLLKGVAKELGPAWLSASEVKKNKKTWFAMVKLDCLAVPRQTKLLTTPVCLSNVSGLSDQANFEESIRQSCSFSFFSF